VFKEIGQTPRAKKCEGMAGLIEEGKKTLEEEGDPAVTDAAFIAAAQRVEHYEIAAYGCLRTDAQLLGLSAAARLPEQNLNEEEAADEKLIALAEGGISQAAVTAGEEEEQE
jgi:ferritin-like metal-binding protein YciE